MPKHHYEIERHIYLAFLEDKEEPKIVYEALACPSRDKWMKAMDEKVESMGSNYVCELIDIP